MSSTTRASTRDRAKPSGATTAAQTGDDRGTVEEKPGFKDRLAAKSPFLGRLFRMLDRYKLRRGNLAAGGATYFGFLSFFPVLAVAFAVIGQVSQVYPDAQQDFVDALSTVLPGIVSVEPEEGKIALSQIAAGAPAIYTVGLLTALYAGLGWVTGLREGLNQIFGLPGSENPNFVLGKLTDLFTLALIGVVLVASVSVGSVPIALSDFILDAIGIPAGIGNLLISVVSAVVGIAANTVLFFVAYRILPKPSIPTSSLWKGALFASIGFEIVKQLASYILRGASSVPIASLAIALTLVVWIFYFSRLTMYGAAWAYTDSAAVEQREAEEAAESGETRPIAGDDDAEALLDEVEPEPDVGYTRPLLVGIGLGALASELARRSAD